MAVVSFNAKHPTSTVTVTALSRTTTLHAEALVITTTAIYATNLLPSSSAMATTWAAPAQYSNLASFNVTKFAYGQSNTQLVSVAKICSVDSGSDDPSPSHLDDARSQTAIQMFYPQGSINPGGKTPQGGADFYGSPLASIKSARNVSMEYAVFFPKNFQWVLGGKLPGLYGGRPGCSGGDAAEDCFSTRLMWRAKGAGELYLVSLISLFIHVANGRHTSTRQRRNSVRESATPRRSRNAMPIMGSPLVRLELRV